MNLNKQETEPVPATGALDEANNNSRVESSELLKKLNMHRARTTLPQDKKDDEQVVN